ncbi:hypothetical protein THIX_30371 [Thiomonas sp. X19]|nr:hypothetical protein THIX_30371 [Thiomonas sp. X19]
MSNSGVHHGCRPRRSSNRIRYMTTQYRASVKYDSPSQGLSAGEGREGMARTRTPCIADDHV